MGMTSLTKREEHRLRVFENRVLRRPFEPKEEEVTGGWKRMHNEGLRNLYASQNIIKVVKSRRMRWAEHAAFTGEIRNEYKILVRKPERKRTLGRLRQRCKDNIRINLKEIGWEDVDWM